MLQELLVDGTHTSSPALLSFEPHAYVVQVRLRGVLTHDTSPPRSRLRHRDHDLITLDEWLLVVRCVAHFFFPKLMIENAAPMPEPNPMAKARSI
jgi:hypothetical protein